MREVLESEALAFGPLRREGFIVTRPAIGTTVEFESQASVADDSATDAVHVTAKKRKTALTWSGDGDSANEHATATRWLSRFLTKLSGLRAEMTLKARLLNSALVKYRPDMIWCHVTQTGRFFTCDNPALKANCGLLTAALRDALQLPCLKEHERALCCYNLAISYLRFENFVRPSVRDAQAQDEGPDVTQHQVTRSATC